MSLSLIVQSTYTTTRAGIYDTGLCLAQCPYPIEQASTTLIPALDELCKKSQVAVSQFSFIGAFQGPGPFTSLRVILASVNGIAHARSIPLVGVDGFDALLQEHAHHEIPLTLALFNAYNQEAYFALQYNGTIIEKGYEPIETLLQKIQQQFPQKMIYCIGQGVDVFKEKITAILANQAHIPYPCPEAPSLDAIAQQAYKEWQHNTTHRQLLPLYLKTLTYKKSIHQ